MNLTEIKQEIKKIKRTSFGVSVPGLRKLAQKIAKQNYQQFLEENDLSIFEQRLLQAFVIGYAKDDIKTLLSYFQRFIPYATSWELTDSLCQNFKITRRYKKEVWRFLMKYQKSKKEFESRIVSVMLLSHYLDDEYIDQVIKTLDSLNTETYYAKMGVAWAIATIMGKYPEKCLHYLQSNQCHLDQKTFNKSLQKIKESYRVNDEIKRCFQNLKPATIISDTHNNKTAC